VINCLAPLLTPLKQNRPHATFDIETDWTDHAAVKMVGFYDGAAYNEFPNVTDLIEETCVKRYRSFKIYAHFGGKFDFVHLAASADRLGLAWSAIMAGKNGARIIALDLHRGSHVFHFVDSWALLQAPLKDLSEAFTPERRKGKIDFKTATHSQLAYYLKEDCIVLWNVIARAQALFLEMGTDSKKTFSATSMSLFRREYLKRPLPVFDWTRKLTRYALTGGRTEVFKRRAPALYNADVNSMYPYVMSTYDPPAHSPRKVGSVEPKSHGIYHVQANINPCEVPPLPLKGERLYFPTGKFETVAWGPEIIQARNAGHDVKVIGGIEWRPEPGAFREFIAKLYELKQRGGAYKLIAKFMMNGLYGKFGTRGYVYEIVKGGKPRAMVKGETAGDTILNDELGIFAREGYRESPNMLHHVGGWILACARVELYDLLSRSEAPCYCDTDSVWSETRFPQSAELGGLHVEPASNALFLAAKLYCYDNANGEHWSVSKGAPYADPCRNLTGFNSGLCTIKGYARAGKLFHRNSEKVNSGVDRKRLGGYDPPYLTGAPVAGLDCPTRPDPIKKGE